MTATRTSPETLYTSAEAAEIAGITIRTLDFWTREGEVLLPENTPIRGMGRHRRWTEQEVAVLSILARLTKLNPKMTVLKVAAGVLMTTKIRKGDRRWIVASEDDAEIVTLKDLPRATAEPARWAITLTPASEWD